MDPAIAALVLLLQELRPAFTQPTFRRFVDVVFGWLLVRGPHAVTGALVASGTAGRRHHAGYHRLFSGAAWEPDELGRLVFLQITRLMPEGAPIPLVMDDTLAQKKGPKIFGLGTHLDPVRSTRRVRIFTFGHVWVVLSVVVKLPFSRRPWALPVLFRLYRNVKDCERNEAPYRKKTELARQMVDVIATWAPERRFELAADSAYCNDTVTRGLAEHVVLYGRMRPDAALSAPPEVGSAGRGRPRVRGARVPRPEEWAKDASVPWRKLTVTLYGSTREVEFKSFKAQWYRACGGRLLTIVVVRVSTGTVPFQVFFCTDPTTNVAEVLERYASRWAIEVTFRDLKQLLGFADSQARTPKAVLRTAPFAGLLYSVVVVWYATVGHGSRFDVVPLRPWYRQRRAPSLADMLEAVRRAVEHGGILDPARGGANFEVFEQVTSGRRRRAA